MQSSRVNDTQPLIYFIFIPFIFKNPLNAYYIISHFKVINILYPLVCIYITFLLTITMRLFF